MKVQFVAPPKANATKSIIDQKALQVQINAYLIEREMLGKAYIPMVKDQAIRAKFARKKPSLDIIH